MNKTLSALAVVLAGTATASALEDTNYLLKTAGDLAALCGAPSDPSAIHMCQGFMVGVHRMQLEIAEATGTQLYCIPQDGSVTRDSISADLSAWIASDAKLVGMKPAEAVITWAKTVHPCT
ncbi:MAG: Rap1a/Tai family immunity protein [Pseudomonadota bacterium]